VYRTILPDGTVTAQEDDGETAIYSPKNAMIFVCCAAGPAPFWALLGVFLIMNDVIMRSNHEWAMPVRGQSIPDPMRPNAPFLPFTGSRNAAAEPAQARGPGHPRAFLRQLQSLVDPGITAASSTGTRT
jgi:hypothetical protein